MNILFLCTGNSARSILSEAYLAHVGRGRFGSFSAGSHPTGQPNPFALNTLSDHGIATDGLSSKSWDVFAEPGAPPLDIVVTVCDNAAGEVCPIWPGGPVKVHWGLPDPAAATGSDADKKAAFERVFETVRGLIDALVASPDEALAPDRRLDTLKNIGAVHLNA